MQNLADLIATRLATSGRDIFVISHGQGGNQIEVFSNTISRDTARVLTELVRVARSNGGHRIVVNMRTSRIEWRAWLPLSKALVSACCAEIQIKFVNPPTLLRVFSASIETLKVIGLLRMAS